ncbi:ABC transporter G family member 33-like [Gossypium australe]|uniref:ABC transporter G family member 33-like n=1 Tax=Gossypium australe TaxID=47621 RepID=A0A5B6VLS1_9ROSI|nr:ABC transporter G family member 33-like [Gossypium australe]
MLQEALVTRASPSSSNENITNSLISSDGTSSVMVKKCIDSSTLSFRISLSSKLVLELPPELNRIHDVFHVSMLRRYRSEPSHVIPIEEIEVRHELTFNEELVQIIDRDVKVLRRK